jgi:hypothetical protein
MKLSAWLNRPLSRYVIRSYLAILHGRDWSHKQDWWPGLTLELPRPNTPGKLCFRDELICDIRPWDELSPPSTEITVIGSGPSAAKQDFSSLPSGSAMLLNGAVHLLEGRIEGPPLAVVVEDERFIWRHFAELRELLAPQTTCLFSTSVMRAICEIDAGWLRTQRIFHIDFVQKPYGHPRPTDVELEAMDFLRWAPSKLAAISLAPNKGVFMGGSVVVTALQFALHWHPERIGFAGIDLSNANEPRFYETAGNTAKSRIVRAQDQILAAFSLARRESDRQGTALVNYSPVSALSTVDIPYDGRLSPESR